MIAALMLGMALSPVHASQDRIHRIALLPFVAREAASSPPGWSLAVKFLSHVPENTVVQPVGLDKLRRLMDEEGIKRSDLLDPHALRKIGLALGVDAVVTGEFTAKDFDHVAWPMLVRVDSGKVVRGKPWRTSQDIVIAPADPSQAQELALRDALSDRGSRKQRGLRHRSPRPRHSLRGEQGHGVLP